VTAVRTEFESTSEIPKLDRYLGEDDKWRKRKTSIASAVNAELATAPAVETAATTLSGENLATPPTDVDALARVSQRRGGGRPSLCAGRPAGGCRCKFCTLKI
jgi:hypothetical protein